MPEPARSAFVRLAAFRPRIATPAGGAASDAASAAGPAGASATRATVRIRDHRTRTGTTPLKAAAIGRWKLNPDIWARFPAKSPYKRRDELTVPVAPAEAIENNTILEGALDASQKFYLPAYRIATQSLARPDGRNTLTFRLSLVPPASEEKPGSLTVHLLKGPPEGVDVAAQNATPLPHEIAIFLQFRDAVMENRLPFDYTEEADGTIKATLGLDLGDYQSVYAAMTNASMNPALMVTRTFTAAVPAPPAPDGTAMFNVVAKALDFHVEPRSLAFPEDDPVFEGRAASASTSSSVIRITVPDARNRHHSYFQRATQADHFYYLPDEIRIARHENHPHPPTLLVRIESTDGKPEDAPTVMEIGAVPVTFPERLEAAEPVLARHCGGMDPQFLPLAPASVTFRLGMPASGTFEERPDARVDLAGGVVQDGLRLTAGEMKSMFDALFGGSSVLMQGEVIVDLGDGGKELIPFVGRADSLAGDPLTSVETYIPDRGGVHTVLRNVTESPVEIRGLRAALERGGKRVSGGIEGLDLSSPVTLPPGGEVTFVVIPETPLDGDGPADAVFDLSGVRVLPDRAAIWTAICDPRVRSMYKKQITVRALASVFKPPAERPDEGIGAVTVEFKGGETVELNEAQLTSVATLSMPMRDWVLDATDEGTYTYRVRVIRNNGQGAVSEWMTDSTDRLFPNIPR